MDCWSSSLARITISCSSRRWRAKLSAWDTSTLLRFLRRTSSSPSPPPSTETSSFSLSSAKITWPFWFTVREDDARKLYTLDVSPLEEKRKVTHFVTHFPEVAWNMNSAFKILPRRVVERVNDAKKMAPKNGSRKNGRFCSRSVWRRKSQIWNEFYGGGPVTARFCEWGEYLRMTTEFIESPLKVLNFPQFICREINVLGHFIILYSHSYLMNWFDWGPAWFEILWQRNEQHDIFFESPVNLVFICFHA